MIINGKDYQGKCECGKGHAMSTEFCVIEKGCLKNFSKYVKQFNFKGTSVAIYDQNTYEATCNVRPNADFEIVLSPENLHADNHGVAAAKESLPAKFDYLIAVGSGTVHDITRYIVYERGVEFISCPTAASVDGFCSSVAAMTWDGFKKTFTAVAPKIVIADLDIISNAPMRLTKSGFGDMVGKFIALADWKIANTILDEYFCQKIYDLVMNATRAVIDSADGIIEKRISAYEKLVYGLLLSGLAMQMLGNSRCASGAEHHISHFIEMQPKVLSEESTALHGEKVGVGTLIASKEYHEICSAKEIEFIDYQNALDDYIENIFGQTLSGSIVAENKNDCATNITKEKMQRSWNKIKDIVSQIPTCENLIKIYDKLNLKRTLSSLQVNEDRLNTILDCSPLVRNRLTLMRLRKTIKNNN